MKYLIIPFFLLAMKMSYQWRGVKPVISTNDSVKIINNYSGINSIRQLLEPFNGKAVLIDLWATWCEPCLEEFKFSDSLHLYLHKKGIEMVYISFDKEELDEKWRYTINNNRLLGSHIRANKTLQNALTTLVWGSKDAYSIPHFVLFDKNGEVLDRNVPEPSDGSKLYIDLELKLAQ